MGPITEAVIEDDDGGDNDAKGTDTR